MRGSPSAPTFSGSRLPNRRATKTEKGALALKGLAPEEMALSLVKNESCGNQPLFREINRQGQTCKSVGPQQSKSIVFSEDHQGDFALVADRDPRLPVVQVDMSSISLRNPAPAPRLNLQLAQQAARQRQRPGGDPTDD